MGQEQGSTSRKGYQHISEKERYQLEGYLKAKMSKKAIARLMNRDPHTIRREIARGLTVQRNSDLTERHEYLADRGQLTKEKNGAMKGRVLKIGHCHKLANFLTGKIVDEHYSPYAAIEAAKASQEAYEVMICYKTLYNYIDNDVFAQITNKDLPVKRVRPKRKYERTRKVALNNLKGKSIEERPKEVEERISEGDWEMDTVVGAQGTKASLLVLTERKTRQELIRKMPDKTRESVEKALKEITEQVGIPLSDCFKSITMDNGSEFLGMKGVGTQQNQLPMYYAHPYSAYERGSNENANKLIRRFIPKGVDIDRYSDADISRIEHWMNHYPRKLHGGRTAHDIANFKVTA